jgi:hypothetical protein
MSSGLIYRNYKTQCDVCKRKILVEVHLIGINHNAGVYATCGDCLLKKGLHKRFVKDSPLEAKLVEEWLKERKKKVGRRTKG